MLAWLRHEAAAELAQIGACTLATAGPAGVQASWESCRSAGLRLYLLLSTTSDHLDNIQATHEVALAGEGWRLVGTGKCLTDEGNPWMLTRQPWQVVVEVMPVTLYLAGEHCQSMRAIDFAPLHP